MDPEVPSENCLWCRFNLTFPNEADAGAGWLSTSHFGINLGAVVLLGENSLRSCSGGSRGRASSNIVPSSDNGPRRALVAFRVSHLPHTGGSGSDVTKGR